MEKEQLIAKGVKCVFNGQSTVFEVESLNEHFDGLQYHESDVVEFEDGKYLKVGDINFTVALRKEVKPVEEIDVTHEDVSQTNAEDTLEEDPKVDFDELSLKYKQMESSDAPEGISIDLDVFPEDKLENTMRLIEAEELKSAQEENELKITPEDPAFGTEGIVSKKTIEEVDAEIKSDNENIKPEDITDVNDVPAETIEKVVEEVKKEEAPVAKPVAEVKPKKTTKKK